MLSYVQETDTRIIIPDTNFSEKNDNYLKHSVKKPSYETFGSSDIGTYQYCITSEKSHLIKTAWNNIEKTKSISMIKNSKNILSIFENSILSFTQLGFNLGILPPLRAYNLEDDSILIEWIFKDFRIGFNIEEDEAENGWYLVCNRKLGDINASGYISNVKIKSIILWLINFVMVNSKEL